MCDKNQTAGEVQALFYKKPFYKKLVLEMLKFQESSSTLPKHPNWIKKPHTYFSKKKKVRKTLSKLYYLIKKGKYLLRWKPQYLKVIVSLKYLDSCLAEAIWFSCLWFKPYRFEMVTKIFCIDVSMVSPEKFCAEMFTGATQWILTSIRPIRSHLDVYLLSSAK